MLLYLSLYMSNLYTPTCQDSQTIPLKGEFMKDEQWSEGVTSAQGVDQRSYFGPYFIEFMDQIHIIYNIFFLPTLS